MTEGNDDKKKLMEQAKELLPSAFKSVLAWFSQVRSLLRYLTVKGQMAVAFLFLALAVWHGYWWWDSFTKVSERIRTSLDAKMVNTVWQHKGLAAYLLSNIEPALAKHEFSEEITNTLDEVRQLAAAPLPASGLRAESVMWMPAPSPRPGIPQADSRKLHLYMGKKLRDAPAGQALVAGDESYFMFVPALAIRREQLSYEPLAESENDAVLKKALDHNPDILRDIYVAQQLIPVLMRLESGRVNQEPVAQFYFITESGLILLRSTRNIANQIKFYGNQFDPSHNFTDRPYFRGAIKKDSSNGSPPEPFDYVSEPYIDLGGHGLIKTYSKAFQLANNRFGVLCVDVPLDQPTRRAVQDRLNVIGGESGRVYWTGSIEDKDKLPNDFDWFQKAMKNDDPRDELLGRIASQKDQDNDQPNDGVLRYTIPWAAELTENGSRKVELMWVRVDLDRFLWNQKLRLFFVCLGVGLFVAVTLNILGEYLFADNELSELAKKIDRVMTHAVNPYVRVNSDNRFVAVNDSFLKMLDYRNINKLQGEGPFRSLLTPESQRTYDRVMKESLRGEPTEEYTLTFLRPDGSQVRTRVLAERIVFPMFRRKKFAHRFGIIISWEHFTAAEGVPARPTEAGKS